MHPSCHEWLRVTVAEFDLANTDTLEVGSLDVNGSARSWFTGTYWGLDITAGRGVDQIADALNLPVADETYATVISTEMLEHCTRPWRAVAEMGRVLCTGGYLILTARGFDGRGCWEVHSYPYDFWRLGEGAMDVLMSDAGVTPLQVTVDPEGPGWFAIGRKCSP